MIPRRNCTPYHPWVRTIAIAVAKLRENDRRAAYVSIPPPTARSLAGALAQQRQSRTRPTPAARLATRTGADATCVGGYVRTRPCTERTGQPAGSASKRGADGGGRPPPGVRTRCACRSFRQGQGTTWCPRPGRCRYRTHRQLQMPTCGQGGHRWPIVHGCAGADRDVAVPRPATAGA